MVVGRPSVVCLSSSVTDVSWLTGRFSRKNLHELASHLKPTHAKVQRLSAKKTFSSLD